MTPRSRLAAWLLVAPLAGPVTIGAVFALDAGCRHAPPPPDVPPSTVARLEAPRQAPHAYGRAGDLVLQDGSGASLTFAASPDQAGHRPLHGALLDAALGAADRTDALLWWRAGWIDLQNRLHVGPAETVRGFACSKGAQGIEVAGKIDGATVESTVCPTSPGTFVVLTQAKDLPFGAVLGDELNPGTSTILADGDGAAVEGDRTSSFVALADAGSAILIEALNMRVQRHRVHIAAESFPAPVVLRFDGPRVTRTLRVLDGDALDALGAASSATRSVVAGLEGDLAAEIHLLDAAGHSLAHGASTAPRVLHVPPGFATSIEVRDDGGVLASRAPLAGLGPRFVVPLADRGELTLRYVEPPATPLPVHVLFRALESVEEPRPRVAEGGFAAGRSVYLFGGTGAVRLAPGRYHMTASHGITYGIDERDVTVTANGHESIDAVLRPVTDTTGWTSGDFHLHSAPSPDAPVSLDERVASLACEGVELAVATDHNRISDYKPSVARLGLADRIVAVSGDEITSSGRASWGHFNAYPLPLAAGAPEDVVPPYFDTAPADMFAAAHDAGARIVQVNHPRMEPHIGYFDLTHLDEATGNADPAFSPAFETVETFNGMWIETPAKVREGAIDLVALARRGMRVTATGNSDSHQLLYEEAGYPRTFVHAPAQPIAGREDRVLLAMLRGDTTVSSGPFVELLVEGRSPGSVVPLPVSHQLRVHVRVSAPAWVPVEHVEIWHDDAIARRFDVPKKAVDGVRFEQDLDLPFDGDGTVLAWADADTPLPDVLPYPHARAIGFTGLVYVDGDGDGKVKVPVKAGGTR